MKTERLFYENVYLKEFKGKVLSCGEQEGTFRIILDRTAFYPEGGGQPAEGGLLGDRNVINVIEENDEIVHITDGPLEVGSQVEGRINWERRFSLMQQHSGEHIVSGMIHNRFGYDNVGFHMGSDFITIDLNGMITEEELEEIECAVNEYIWQNNQVYIFYPDREELKNMDYRSKKELSGEVRLVEFPDMDLCACCGTHVAWTGEIGLVKLVSVKKFREGVRIEMLCGKDAFEYLNMQYKQNSKIGVALSVKADETYGAVQRLEKEITDLKMEIAALKQGSFAKTAQSCSQKGNVVLFEENLEAGDIRRLADAVLDCCGGICALFSGDDEKGYKYALGERDGNVRELVKEMNGALNGRGGGKPFFAQGSLMAEKKEILAFFEAKKFSL